MAANTVACENGELLIAAAPDVRIRDDEIVFITKQALLEPGHGDRSKEDYLLCWLRTTAPEDGTGKDGSDAAEKSLPPFQLSTQLLAPSAVQQLPPGVLDRHLLTAIPPVIRAATTATAVSSSSLHVVVSTQSGTGQAESFYDAAVRPLLACFGLRAAGGGSEPVDRDDGVAAAMKAAAATYNVLFTSSPQSVAAFARTLAAEENATTTTGAPVVILLSGDGGVVDLLNGVDAQGHGGPPLATIALLPLGTGNALFHSLHKPLYAAAAAGGQPTATTTTTTTATATTGPSPFVWGLRTLVQGRAAPLPNFEATFAPGAHTVRYVPENGGGTNDSDRAGDASAPPLHERDEPVARLRGAIVASYGFHAQLVWESDTPAYRKHGAQRFGMAAQALLETSHAYAATVQAWPPLATRDGATESNETGPPRLLGQRFNYVLATLVSNLERTFTISPASRPLDGQLRLVHFGAVGGARTMEVMMAAYNDASGEPRQDDEERVGYEAVEALEVVVHEHDARWRKVCIDGTIVEIPEGGWMRVRKAAQPVLQIIVNN
ncbi:cortical actin cytoskeleton protein vip1 [Niveomyces insectorum RCEF 264]|uniref:Cortical actin cytoskeleton protein vip1 n=1 Tax=Niveomyces insectorum RCEF 264 TaxID=1081102 RepID=A0A167MWK8_9HYPO|nr:cortical actin cytoskeleton protein vip1 [Niveomyces insectorum RCEF 264]